jgi:REP element-mobilizing transposase RayT
MPRSLRIEFPGALYHVTSRGNNQARIFWDDADRLTFLGLLGAVVARDRFELHAYCLMGNHYHAVLRTPEGNLARGMQRLNSAFAQHANSRHPRSGHLFQGRYDSRLVEEEPYLLQLARYVVLNPVRAGLVATPAAWRWSSYRATAGLELAPAFLTTSWLLEQFGADEGRARQRYRVFVAEGLADGELTSAA